MSPFILTCMFLTLLFKKLKDLTEQIQYIFLGGGSHRVYLTTMDIV